MDRLEEPAGDAVVDRAVSKTDLEQLGTSHHAVVAGRELSDGQLAVSVRIARSLGAKCTLTRASWRSRVTGRDANCTNFAQQDAPAARAHLVG